MSRTQVAVVGGGLAGLYAARELTRAGVDYVLLEARETVGGRILSRTASALPLRSPRGLETGPGARDRFDLGATWYWPELQPQLHQLIQELGLISFAQPTQGEWLHERSRQMPPIRAGGYPSSPPAMRLLGGMASLTDALTSKLNAARILTNHRVLRIEAVDEGVRLQIGVRERTFTLVADQVILAVPPRLAAVGIEFVPPLPRPLERSWLNTPTWMAPHAKYVAVFETAFWQDDGLAGSAQSMVGPMAEIHDASMPGGSAALFGFLGLPAQVRSQVGQQDLVHACRDQLTRLFGARAARPRVEWLQDWTQERYTATVHDDTAEGHAQSPASIVETDRWRNKLIGGASEWSPQFSGYVAGAIDAAGRAVGRVLEAVADAKSRQVTRQENEA